MPDTIDITPELSLNNPATISMLKPTGILDQQGYDLIDLLKTMDGAIPYDGDASVQVIFKLHNGRTLRFCVSDFQDGLMVDQYAGLAVAGGDPQLR